MADPPPPYTPENTPTPGHCINCGARIYYPRAYVHCKRCGKLHGPQLHLDLEETP